MKKQYGIDLISKMEDYKYDIVVITVAHDWFPDVNLKNIRKEKSIIYDLKYILPTNEVDGQI